MKNVRNRESGKSGREKFEISKLQKITKDLEKDTAVLKRVDEFRRQHGTLTQQDLTKIFTI